MNTKEYVGLNLWSKVEKSDTNFLRKADNGKDNKKKNFYAIDDYYQIKTATSLWGPYGGTWGLKSTELEFRDFDKTTMAIYKAVFYSPAGEFEIRNSIKVSDDEFLKKLETDTLTKALSRLGFNADVFLGYYDNNRYTEKGKPQVQPPKTQTASQPEQSEQKETAQSKHQDNSTKEDGSDILQETGIFLKNEEDLLIASGNTYNNKSLLHDLGFKYDWVESLKKKAWFKVLKSQKVA